MEIAQPDDIQVQAAHSSQILDGRVERAALAQAPGEVQMEMIGECLVSSNRLEAVAVREGKHRVPSGVRGFGGDVKVYGHALPGAGRRVEQGKVVAILLRLLALGLADADRELLIVVLAVPDISQVGIDFAGKEKGMRGREYGYRSAPTFGYEQAIGGLDRRDRVILWSAKEIRLLVSAGIVPNDSRGSIDRKTIEPGLELIGG